MAAHDTASHGYNPAAAYDRLHREVQQWVWGRGWGSLRTVQAMSVGPILDNRDVVIAAATASGKTEAAWLPICSALARARDDGPVTSGIQALYVGPLKALINDQYLRLETLGEAIGVEVTRWHGDVAGSTKRKLLTRPRGILLITPESLEALFVREGHKVAGIFNALRYIVVDELHSFIGSERGAQLQSLMHRIDLAARRRVPRAGLSATLADLSIASEFLRPGRADQVVVVDAAGSSAEVMLQLRGYTKPAPDPSQDTAHSSENDGDDDDGAVASADALAIADHLFQTLRGSHSLVFANSRAFVEAYADLLTRRSDRERVPNEFFPHHGNLSKEYREDVETRLRATELPATAICTATLEMGVDIGTTDSIAQVGAPGSVAALRQRLGRSGRRGSPAVMRLYISEREVDELTPPADRIRAQLTQTIAMTNLMLDEHWYEPPNTADLHLSTLVQQVLSVIAQHGGANAADLYSSLCQSGPFARVDKATFVALLRGLGEADVLHQSSDGLLVHGGVGDKLVNHYSFYSAFKTADEYRLVSHGRTLGSIPIDYPVLVGSLLIFAGKRWAVLNVDTSARVIELSRASGGRPPSFSGGGIDVADLVRIRMRELYESDTVPLYLNRTAQELLAQGRTGYRHLGLHGRALVDWGNDTVVFPWRGDRVLNTIAVALTSQGLAVGIDGVALTLHRTRRTDVLDALRALASVEPPDPEALAVDVPNMEHDKYDEFLTGPLLAKAYAARNLNVPEAWDAIRALAAEPNRDGDSQVDLTGIPGSRLSPAAWVPQRGSTGFAVIDVETTGFDPEFDDRIIEIAVVHTDPAGNITGRWTTLVNPERDTGPAHIHGIGDDDVLAAPKFADLTAWLSELLDRRIVVGHHAEFDLAFLTFEFERADVQPPLWPTLDTMHLAKTVNLCEERDLAACCEAAGVTIDGAHTAGGDATATAELLCHLLGRATDAGLTTLDDLGWDPGDSAVDSTRASVGQRPRPVPKLLPRPT